MLRSRDRRIAVAVGDFRAQESAGEDHVVRLEIADCHLLFGARRRGQGKQQGECAHSAAAAGHEDAPVGRPSR